MSALAQFLRWEGLEITGSDRLGDNQAGSELQRILTKDGCRVFPQDGSGITDSTDLVVVSTAVEPDNPDLCEAEKRNILVLHRSEVLATIAENKKTIAVAGTSGKSTVTAMIFDLLDACGMHPSVITGAPLNRLTRKGTIGNAWKGESDLLIIEADESDGSLVRYHPWMTVFLNVSKDHKPVDETIELFQRIGAQSELRIVNKDDPRLNSLPCDRGFSLTGTASFSASRIENKGSYYEFSLGETDFRVNLPGLHNVSNMVAALCVCDYLDCGADCLQKAVQGYAGIRRRFTVLKTARGIPVIDDYAHNPEKIRAAIEAARGMGSRLIALFQPHGFGPTRFMKNELIEMFSVSIHKDDILMLLPIYYAGGTAAKDISSEDIAEEVSRRGVHAQVIARHEASQMVSRLVRPGDCVLSMGARDPGLEAFALDIARDIDADRENQP